MDLLHLGEAAVEHRRLGEVIVEGRGLGPLHRSVHLSRGLHIAAFVGSGDDGLAAVDAVGPVGRLAGVDGRLVHTVAQHVVDRAAGPVDGQLREVGPAQPGQLRVQVREQASLHQRVVGRFDAGHEVTGVERDLLGFGEVVRGVAVEGQLADRLHRHQFLGDDLRRVEQVDPGVGLRAVVGHHLHAQFVFEERPLVDAVGHVAAVEVGIAAGRDLCLLPHQRVHTGHRLPVELRQTGLALGVDQPEGVHAEPFHRAVRARDAAVAHVPHDVVGGFGVQRHEIPEGVVRRLRLGDLPIRVRLARMDHIGELDAVLDEEHRHVVADEVEVALLGVELDREAAGVAHGVGGAARAQHRREAAEHVGLRALFAEESGLADRRRGAVGLEHPVRGGAAGVHDALGNSLVVEVGDLLPEVEVLEQGRAA